MISRLRLAPVPRSSTKFWGPCVACRASGLPACQGRGRPVLRCSLHETKPQAPGKSSRMCGRIGGCSPLRSASVSVVSGAPSVRTPNAKCDGFFQSRLYLRRRHQRQCISGNCAIVAGAANGVLDRLVFGHQRDRPIEVAVAKIAFAQRPVPECALTFGAASEGEDYRQSDFTFPEIITDVLTEFRGFAAIVESVVDQLKGNAEIHSERSAGRQFCLLFCGKRGTYFTRSGKQLCGLGADD